MPAGAVVGGAAGRTGYLFLWQVFTTPYEYHRWQWRKFDSGRSIASMHVAGPQLRRKHASCLSLANSRRGACLRTIDRPHESCVQNRSHRSSRSFIPLAALSHLREDCHRQFRRGLAAALCVKPAAPATIFGVPGFRPSSHVARCDGYPAAGSPAAASERSLRTSSLSFPAQTALRDAEDS